MSDQVDILHPLTTLKWEKCGQVPEELRGDPPQCVVVGEKVYLSFIDSLYVSTDLYSWTKLSRLPSYQGTLTIYRSQLVLVGGEEASDNNVTNKLWMLSEAGVWQESLPPMPTKCCKPVVVSGTDPECLVVIGRYGEEDNHRLYRDRASRVRRDMTRFPFIEVLIGDQWFHAEQPGPLLGGSSRFKGDFSLRRGFFQGGIIHNGMLYVHGWHNTYSCDFQSLIAFCRHPYRYQQVKWRELSPSVRAAVVSMLLNFREQLVMVCQNMMYLHFPLIDNWPWASMGRIPVEKILGHPGEVISSAVLPTGDVLAIRGFRHRRVEFMRMSLIMSPYDPDSRFTMSSLARLEAAGIKVVSALQDNIKNLRNKILRSGVTVQSVIEEWSVIEWKVQVHGTEQCPPMTWRSLLDIISQGMNMRALSQQIEDHLQHVSRCDPDSQFNMSSLTKLEAAGIKVVTALQDNIEYLGNKIYHFGDSVENVTEQWEVRDTERQNPPMTWRSLLNIISQGMNMRELSQQLEDYLQHGPNKVYLDAYHQLLATRECLEMWFLKVILIGAPRLGKTTMRRRLTGEIDDISSSGEGEQPSTGAVESGPSIVIRNLSSTTALITESQWSATKDLTEETCAILQYFYSHISEKKTVQSSTEVSDTAPIADSTEEGDTESNEVTNLETDDIFVTPNTSPAPSGSESPKSYSPEHPNSPAPSRPEHHNSPAPSGPERPNSYAPSGQESTNIPAPSGPEHPNIPAPSGPEHPNIPAPSGPEHPNIPAPSGSEHPNIPAPSGQDSPNSAPVPLGTESCLSTSPAPSGLGSCLSTSPDPENYISISPSPSDSESYSSYSSVESSDLESYSPPPAYRFSIPEMIRNAVTPECWREITQVCRDTAFLNMGDTGGQPEFMDMQPALTVGPALYLFFCKLTDDLDSLYKVSYLSPSTGESTVPRESAYTAKEVLFTSLASIACFKSSSSTALRETTSSTADQLLSSCDKPIAYIIGTHKDLVSEEQICEFDEKLQQNIRPTDFFKEDIVQFASEERMVLPVDNMHGGRDEIRNICKLLEDSMKKHFKKLSIPASWLVLSLCLRKREERTASLENVLQLASELGIPESEVMVALWFLHHCAGVLMYFPNLPELKDTVICDNQIIYDSATNLIVNTFKFRSVGKAASERFRKTGQFSLEDIGRATAGVSGDYIPLEKLVKLLAFLKILVSFVKSTSTSLSSRTLSSEEMYFMPSVLLNATHEEMASWWDDTHKQVSPAPLFIRYQCGFVPIGVFPAMIANLTANAALQLRVEGIRKNRVQFLIGSDFDTITLVSQPTYYAVHISRRKSTKTPTHEVCATVRGLVESTLKTVTSRMNYTFTAENQLGFECPSHPGREHLCVVDSNDPSPHVMCCQENMDNLKPVDMQNKHLVWFGKPSSCDDSEAESSPRLPVAKTKLSLPSLHLLKWKDEKGQEQEFRLIKKVSARWYEFGLLLRVDYNELDAWESQYRGNAKKCWIRVIDDWLTRGGSHDYPATWEGLYCLLDDLEFGSVAVKLKEAVLGQISHST